MNANLYNIKKSVLLWFFEKLTVYSLAVSHIALYWPDWIKSELFSYEQCWTNENCLILYRCVLRDAVIMHETIVGIRVPTPYEPGVLCCTQNSSRTPVKQLRYKTRHFSWSHLFNIVKNLTVHLIQLTMLLKRFHLCDWRQPITTQ